MNLIKFSKVMQRKIMKDDTTPGISAIIDEKLHPTFICYRAKSSFMPVNIKTVFNQSSIDDNTLITFYKKYLDTKNDTWDDIAIKLAKAVNKRLTYKNDDVNWGQVEYWASPIEIHNKKQDDCDGYAVLTVYLWGLFGIPAYRRFVRAGNVVGGGHATALYLSLATNEIYPLEGSYYASESWKNFNKIPFHVNQKYTNTWWITNENKSYSGSWFLKFIKGMR